MMKPISINMTTKYGSETWSSAIVFRSVVEKRVRDRGSWSCACAGRMMWNNDKVDKVMSSDNPILARAGIGYDASLV